jgi:protein-S-isoprenylcysteine O-methyltransferase Ste14
LTVVQPVDRLLLRSTLSFAALPGIVAYLVPFLIVRTAAGPPRVEGLIVAIAGTIILLWCVHDFHVKGRGTLAPWDPPSRLVITGLYRYSRNPMYVGVLMVLLGWAVAWRSETLWLYAGTMWLVFHLRVMLGEERWLAARYGDEWNQYRRAVPRWIGRRREGN